MRLKSYYSSKEITNNLYTYGNEYQLFSGAEYIGLYHKYTTGEVYTQPEWNSKLSSQLFPIDNRSELVKKYNPSTKLQLKYENNPIYKTPVIQLSDIQSGFITRYFIKKINEFSIIEIDESQYINRNKLFDPKLYTLSTLQWFIVGELQDTVKDNIKIPGVLTKNKNAIKTAQQQIPDIGKNLTNLQEFYINANIQIPPDINE